MVLSGSTEARRQRVLLKRQCAKQENVDQARSTEPGHSNDVAGGNVKENTTETVNAEKVQPEKKPKLEMSDDGTVSITENSHGLTKIEDTNTEFNLLNGREIVSNVFRYLKQEYKFMQMCNVDNCNLRPLAAIRRRTAAATGLTKDVIGQIVKEDRARMTDRRKRNHEGQRKDAVTTGTDKQLRDINNSI